MVGEYSYASKRLKIQEVLMQWDPGHVCLDFNLSDEVLNSVDCVKLLGVQLDGKLDFDQQVSLLYLRASLEIRA